MWDITGGLIIPLMGACFPHTVGLTTGSLLVSAVLSRYITAASPVVYSAVGTGRLVLSGRPDSHHLSVGDEGFSRPQPGALSHPDGIDRFWVSKHSVWFLGFMNS